jgi:NitT/TauT family transport system permease protein
MWFAGIDEVSVAMLDIFQNYLKEITNSFYLILKSSLITIVLGTLLGLIIGFYNKLYESLNWSLDFWRSIPPIMVIGIMLNLDSTDYKWRIWLVIFGALPLMIMQIADAVNSISKKRLQSFESVSPSTFFKIKNIVFFEILPSFFSTTRTVISFSIIIIIVSEMMFSPQYGIGKAVLNFQTAYQIDFLYAFIILVGLIGVFLNKLLRFVEKRIIKWE